MPLFLKVNDSTLPKSISNNNEYITFIMYKFLFHIQKASKLPTMTFPPPPYALEWPFN